MCHDSALLDLSLCDVGDFDFGVGLAMTKLMILPFSRLILHGSQLFAFCLSHQFAFHCEPSNIRSANLMLFSVKYEEHIAELDGIAFRTFQKLNADYISLRDFVLLATCFDNSVHEISFKLDPWIFYET